MRLRTIVGVLIWIELVAVLVAPIWTLGAALFLGYLAVAHEPSHADLLIEWAPLIVGGLLGAFALLRVTYSVTFGDPSNIPVRSTYVLAACGFVALVAAAFQFIGIMRCSFLIAGAVAVQIWCMWLVKLRRRGPSKEAAVGRAA